MDYKFALSKNDIKIIDRINVLTNAETFWDDVRKLSKNVYSDKSIQRWKCLSEMRYKELVGDSNGENSISQV